MKNWKVVTPNMAKLNICVQDAVLILWGKIKADFIWNGYSPTNSGGRKHQGFKEQCQSQTYTLIYAVDYSMQHMK